VADEAGELPLQELSTHLATREYLHATPSLKVRALDALCDLAMSVPPPPPQESREQLDTMRREVEKATNALRLAENAAAALPPLMGATSRQQQVARTEVDAAVRRATEAVEALIAEEAQAAPRLRDAVRLPCLGVDREGTR
jgi:hypothetical protein